MYLCSVESLSWFQSKLDFLKNLKVAPKLGQTPCTIVQAFDQILSKMTRKEFCIFITFSDTYTCTYVV